MHPIFEPQCAGIVRHCRKIYRTLGCVVFLTWCRTHQCGVADNHWTGLAFLMAGQSRVRQLVDCLPQVKVPYTMMIRLWLRQISPRI